MAAPQSKKRAHNKPLNVYVFQGEIQSPLTVEELALEIGQAVNAHFNLTRPIEEKQTVMRQKVQVMMVKPLLSR